MSRWAPRRLFLPTVGDEEKNGFKTWTSGGVQVDDGEVPGGVQEERRNAEGGEREGGDGGEKEERNHAEGSGGERDERETEKGGAEETGSPAPARPGDYVLKKFLPFFIGVQALRC